MESDDDKTQTHHVLSNGIEVGHYRIIEKIGAGGMGEVFLAEDTKLKRQVALKFLPEYLVSNDDAKLRFTREAQAAAKLNHPNIVTIHEVGEFHNRPFFAMEYVEGRSLKNFIDQGNISIEFALGIASQLCEGLGKAHREGIIHRDIKPSNIIIDSDGRARLVDFGLATLKQDEKITKTGSTLGTIGYMSPEQVKCKELDNRSDLFSLGVVFYEMVTGHQPFRGDFEAATLNAIVNDDPKPLADYISDFPEELQRIISKLLEKDPAFRYQTAAGVCPDLKKLAGDDSPAVVASRPVDWWNRYVVVGAVIILAIVFGYWFFAEYLAGPSKPSEPKKLMLAVLPFNNLGDEEDGYFADGITDEITSRLAMVHGMGVISRTSAYAYKNSEKTLPQIAKELGVDYILEGTIRWDKTGDVERVRVTPQLIRVEDDLHMWAENYEEVITGIFEVQVAIARHIIDALDLTLATSERTLIEDQPTDNIEAYNLYLQGKEYWDLNKIDLALPLLERSVEVDSTFARAYGLLARLHGFSYYNMLDRTPQRLEKCEKAAHNAVRFSDGGVDGNIAMGYYFYYGLRDYDRALEEFEKVSRLQPSNSDVRTAIAYVQRRRGKWREAAENLRFAHNIDPHSLNLVNNYVITLHCMRQYDEIIRILDRFLLVTPGATELLFLKAEAVLESSRDTSKFREILDRACQYGEKDVVAFYMEGFDIILGDYESATRRRKVPGDFFLSDSTAFYLNKGDAYLYWGRDSISRIYYDSARIVSENEIEAIPEMAFIHSNLGCALAGLGRFQDAIREGKKAVELCPITRDAFYGPAMMGELACIYTAAGEYDQAIDILDSLMKFPSGYGIYNLRLHPRWMPLRAHPRFKALLEKYD